MEYSYYLFKYDTMCVCVTFDFPDQKKYGNSRFRVALDMEDCLDRFYGGYYSGKLFILLLVVCRYKKKI